jgi:cytoskeletal protein RodZ
MPPFLQVSSQRAKMLILCCAVALVLIGAWGWDQRRQILQLQTGKQLSSGDGSSGRTIPTTGSKHEPPTQQQTTKGSHHPSSSSSPPSDFSPSSVSPLSPLASTMVPRTLRSPMSVSLIWRRLSRVIWPSTILHSQVPQRVVWLSLVLPAISAVAFFPLYVG